MVAKWVGIKCSQFAIGMGNCFMAYRKGIGFKMGSTEKEYNQRIVKHLNGNPEKDIDQDGVLKMDPEKIDQANSELGLGETEYRLNYLPLGGYVKMLGQEDMDPNARSTDKRSYNNKPIWARMCVISAGVVMNTIFAFLFFILAFMIGVNFPDTIVGRVAADSPAIKAVDVNNPKNIGLKIGDKIETFDGEPVDDFTILKMRTALATTDQKVNLGILRDGQKMNFFITPKENEAQNLKYLGLGPSFSLKLPQFNAENPKPLIFEENKIDTGMTLTAVNGTAITQYHELHNAIQNTNGKPVTLTFTAKGKTKHTISNYIPLAIKQIHVSTDEKTYLAHHLGLVPTAQVDTVTPNSKAEKLGLKAGDIFKQTADAKWPSAQQLVKALSDNKGKAIKVTVIRDNKPVTLAGTVGKDGKLGFILGSSSRINQTLADQPFAVLNLTPGSKILSINDKPVNDFDDIPRIVQPLAQAGEKLTLNIKYQIQAQNPKTASQTIELTTEQAIAISQTKWTHRLPLQILEKKVKAHSLSHATTLGYDKTKLFFIQTYQTLARLVTGEVSAKNLSGPIGIANIGTQITQHKGWTYLLYFLGMISINLAVLNFLPIPVVDGGHMVFLIIEKIKGSPVSVGVQAAATYIGLFALLGLFIFATFNDIARFFN